MQADIGGMQAGWASPLIHKHGQDASYKPRTTGRWDYHGNVGLEYLLDEFVLGGVDQLDDVTMQTVSVLLQETCTHIHTEITIILLSKCPTEKKTNIVSGPTSCLIVDDSSKVLDTKLSLVRVLWGDVVCVELML